ncbi:MAG: DNA polymerase III subunit alpha [Patescibacteria group bacterium]|nr:DNA polymerase III subunit alpha [Patescibacteria group bacterium]
MSFVHLHTHSHYSLLDGLPKIDELVLHAKELGMPAAALTDHGVMYGIVEFYQACKNAGIKPILGVETYVAPNRMQDKRAHIDTRPYHLILLAKNQEGYRNLLKLISKAHVEGFYYKPRIDFELLSSNCKGLIGLTACIEGQIAREALSNVKQAKETALKYQEIFGKENYYLELQHHPTIKKQAEANEKLIAIAKEIDAPLVATNDIHYLKKEDDRIQDILLCIQLQKKVDDKNRMSMMGEDFSMKPTEEMERSFANTPEAISNTLKIAEQCNVEIELGKTKLPYFIVPKELTPMDYLKNLCEQGLLRRFGKNRESLDKVITERLDYELSVIEKTGFASYFLIVSDFVNWAKDTGIVVGPGRGSAAGSLIAYLLRITDLDPIKNDLLFERFLNPERISMPDIDMDFADTRRGEVLQYVKRKYGADHVAQIVTFGKMAAKAAVRDAGRVLSHPYDYCDKAAKMIPLGSTISEALKINPELTAFYNGDPQAKVLFDSAKKLEGVARHSSTHACGVVITKDPLDTYTPYQFSTRGDEEITTQYEMHAIENLGLLKMDFLGLANLTIIEKALEIIEAVHGVKVDMTDLAMDDKITYDLLQKAQTVGVFQLESAGMRRYLKLLKPTNFEDLIAMVALYRPGPMEWIPSYIDGKHGRKKVEYVHPKLEPILKKTFGIAVYQEQLMQIARDLAGFTLGEADVLRKAVGKKIKELLEEQKDKFIKGCVANGILEDVARKVFAFIEPFAGYGFNRSHAACYALIGYRTAYLKSHYPVEFMASLLTSDQQNMDRIAIEITECEEMGIEVLPPDVNESFPNFGVVKERGKCIRFAFNAIKNVGETIASAIYKERKKAGKFKDFSDFVRRVRHKDLNKKSIEALAKSGALDSLIERNQVLQNIDKILSFSKSIQKELDSGQTDLFGNKKENVSTINLKLDPAEPASKKERLLWEKELLGLYVSEHPVDEYKDYLNAVAIPINQLNVSMNEQKIKVGGVIAKTKKIFTKKNEPMLFVEIEDLTGSCEIVVFPSVLKKNPLIWQEEKIVLIDGKVNDRDGEVKILADKVKIISDKDIEVAKEEIPKSIEINIPKTANSRIIEDLKPIILNNLGSTAVFLNVPYHDGSFKKIKAKSCILYDPKVLSQLEMIVGTGNISIIKAETNG